MMLGGTGCEGEEGVRPMRGLIVPRPVLPHAPALVPLLAVRPKPPQPQAAALLVELAAGKGRPRRRDRLPLALRPLDHGRVEPKPAHHPLGAALSADVSSRPGP